MWVGAVMPEQLAACQLRRERPSRVGASVIGVDNGRANLFQQRLAAIKASEGREEIGSAEVTTDRKTLAGWSRVGALVESSKMFGKSARGVFQNDYGFELQRVQTFQQPAQRVVTAAQAVAGHRICYRDRPVIHVSYGIGHDLANERAVQIVEESI